MIKGINDNLDNVISYKDLPETVIMTILPFKDVLIYDGVIMNFGIKMGNTLTIMPNSLFVMFILHDIFVLSLV